MFLTAITYCNGTNGWNDLGRQRVWLNFGIRAVHKDGLFFIYLYFQKIYIKWKSSEDIISLQSIPLTSAPLMEVILTHTW